MNHSLLQYISEMFYRNTDRFMAICALHNTLIPIYLFQYNYLKVEYLIKLSRNLVRTTVTETFARTAKTNT